MTRPSLLIVSFSPIASDARVLKQVRLFTPGYDVTTCGYGPVPEGVTAHLEIPASAIAWRKAPVPLLTRQYQRVYDGNEAVVAARRLLDGLTFDVVLADDVDTVPLALALKPARGVHADLHEYAPKQNTELRRWRWFVAPYMRWLCRKYVTQSQSVTTVGRGIADEYERVFGIKAEVVTNAAPYADLTPTPVADGGPIRLVHAGAALRNRHLETLIDAVQATSTDVTLDLFLVANQPDYLAELAARITPGGRVRLHDPLPYAELITTLNGYDVGVHVLPPVSFNNAWALPNKLFDFVQARLGVIVGPSPEMARIVREHGLGAVADDFGVPGLVAVLDALTPSTVEAWKGAADAAAETLSSQAQVKVWEQALTRLVS